MATKRIYLYTNFCSSGNFGNFGVFRGRSHLSLRKHRYFTHEHHVGLRKHRYFTHGRHLGLGKATPLRLQQNQEILKKLRSLVTCTSKRLRKLKTTRKDQARPRKLEAASLRNLKKATLSDHVHLEETEKTRRNLKRPSQTKNA